MRKGDRETEQGGRGRAEKKMREEGERRGEDKLAKLNPDCCKVRDTPVLQAGLPH